MRASSAVLLAFLTVACGGDAPAAAPKTAAATVQHPRTEAELTTITLSPEAVKRLGIESVAASVESVAGSRTLGGEVVVPEGRVVVVTAPVSGTLTAGAAVRPGVRVARGTTIFRLSPLASNERDQRIEIERAVASAQAEEEAARQRLQRLEQLIKEGATSQRAVEEARAQHQIGGAALAAARERLAVVTRNPIGAGGTIAITAPLSGVLQSMSATGGQAVAASSPLFEIAQVETLWIRVPVYAGSLRDLDQTQPALVSGLSATGPPMQARRIAAPLRADPAAASVDLFYEVEPGAATLRPGERVTVQLPLAAAANGLVVPMSAVVYDVHGDTWVYVDAGNNMYARRRVEIARLVGDKAVIARGLSEGQRIVTVGTAELFGTEFGAGK